MRTTLIAVLSAVLLGGCATRGDVTPPELRSPADPWEPLNRRIDWFNTKVDSVTLKPAAKAYRAVVPQLARDGVSNFYGNLWTPLTAVNNFLQGKGADGFSDIGRFLMNSSVGLLGVIDVATEFGLEEHDEDFGQTLAVWGVGKGPYVVIPFLGPSTLRDTVMRPANTVFNPLYHYNNTSVQDKLVVLQIVDLRTRLLSAEEFLEGSSDPYITLRESYLQNRNFEVHDGNPPMDDDFYEEFEEDFE
ncbi:MAG: VacJ family lipoprotein [Woeseia sp.]